MRQPTKPPTPAEFAVLAMFVSAAFIVMGVVALVVAWRAPAEKHELAANAMNAGFWSVSTGVAIAVAFWLYRRLSR